MAGRVILAAGGTGGHLFPAEALAEELLARGHQPVLLTDSRGADLGTVLGNIERHTVRAGTVTGRSIGGRIRGMAEIAAGTLQAGRLLGRLTPLAVVGFGGYPSLPTMLAATRAGLATVIHEQNAVLGRVNRLLAGRVTAIALSFTETARLRPGDAAKVSLIGNPVRQAVQAVRHIAYLAPPPEAAINLLVLGGSQGAQVLADVVPAALGLLPEALRRRIRLTQQCRPEDLERVREACAQMAIAADLASFFADLPARLAATHLAITRAGASTVSELAVAGRPALLVPLPSATDDHQTANARLLEAAGGGWLVPQPRFQPQPLCETIAALTGDPHFLASTAEKARQMGRPEAAHDLASLVESLANESQSRHNAGAPSSQGAAPRAAVEPEVERREVAA
ncbi:MAG: undecaprenyldiphospho-muramoylpentapeptide beta-N-acetylglucosaminyltransferase [Alphaproteobacteria bacterium]|jgi:UDP-N-acetylglucosamine--N-acetylmuramyl-(pentapeptide) pyrophosphoryl-undecaprenol N-acetylglucosamine transferase|nr:undecaprenyldiphospho-muramoylpentapeptide beta-N-acetylglucosaminyltransferase [Alphaproteobacteria bacterium]MDP6270547.1 undecaprenyldiphospho-muramoylpentapeptide beta-N-acetylglucosaminyltransferase [Alphaproteobacteria bacterium]MDP7428304.1 undecaprenyldiphospho-muramoylpentapeptide beta-N-acetylglucosaminyltransferase [Alphaproteobacteria bacterium]